MTTVLVSGVGGLGGWVLEFLARSAGVDRIVTVKRSPWSGPSHTTLAMLGSVFQGHTKQFEHHQVELLDTAATARLLALVRPDVIIHAATIQSPRRLMRADIPAARLDMVQAATFGFWLPWHLLPAARLVEAIEAAGIDTAIVNASFPDVVNVALWRRYGYGPRTGAGNAEVCAVRILRYAMERFGALPSDIEISLVGSHALFSYGPAVPHHLHITVEGRDRTNEIDLEEALTRWPEPIEWRTVDMFSLFAASAVKNALAILGAEPVHTHVTSPDGLPGGFPATIEGQKISVRPPPGLDLDTAVEINDRASRWDGIERIEDDGTVVYTEGAAAAMAELGYEYSVVRFDDLQGQSDRLTSLYRDLVS